MVNSVERFMPNITHHTTFNTSSGFPCASSDELFIVCANTNVGTLQTNKIQLLPVNDDRVRGRLVTVATTLLVTAAANGGGGGRNDGEEEEKKKRVVNLGVTANMSALASNCGEERCSNYKTIFLSLLQGRHSLLLYTK